MQNNVRLQSREKYLILILIISSILPLLDGSIINIILPELAKYFSVNTTQIQWVVTAYFLASIIGLLTVRFLQNSIGLKKTWMLACILFASGSLCVGLSFNFTSLILSRTLQGFSAGLLLPLSQTIIVSEFGQIRVPQIMGLVAVPAVFAPAIGPLLGVLMVQYLSWQVLFLINIPFVIGAVILGAKFLSKSEPEQTNFNFWAFLTFSITLLSFFYALDKAYTLNYKTLILLFSISIIFLGLFVIFNKKSTTKLLYLHNFKHCDYSLLMLMGLFITFLFYSFMIYYPIVFSLAGKGTNNSIWLGLVLALQGVGAWLGRKYIYQRWKQASPFLMLGVGIIISIGGLSCFGFNLYLDGVGFLLRGAGLGVATIICLSAPLQYVDKTYVKDTAVITRIIQQAGGAIGGVVAGLLLHFFNDQYISLKSSYHIFTALSIVCLLILLCVRLLCIIKNKV